MLHFLFTPLFFFKFSFPSFFNVSFSELLFSLIYSYCYIFSSPTKQPFYGHKSLNVNGFNEILLPIK